MKVTNIMNYYVNKEYDIVKKPEMVGIQYQSGTGQYDSHGYSYGLCRKQMQELGDVMGFDRVDFKEKYDWRG